MTFKKRVLLFLVLVLFSGGQVSWADDVKVSVAASMTDVFKKLACAFSATHPEIVLQCNFGSSGALAKQIIQGAPADIYVSANEKWMDYLIQAWKIDVPSVRVFAYNTLVFVGHANRQARTLADLKKLDRIALGSPQSVPAGQYAAQAMRAAGIYEGLLARNKLIMAKDVRQALLYADRGEVDGAFVYHTDALLAQQAEILFRVPPELYARIAYPLALTRSGKSKSGSRVVYGFVNGEQVRGILESYGFQGPMPKQDARP